MTGYESEELAVRLTEAWLKHNSQIINTENCNRMDSDIDRVRPEEVAKAYELFKKTI